LIFTRSGHALGRVFFVPKFRGRCPSAACAAMPRTGRTKCAHVEPIGSADQINVSEAGYILVMLKTKNKTNKHHDSKMMIVLS
jgi:hypothetical protein